ncbi:hypothetical protein DTJ06_05875 [Parasaccharibacter sp. TMW 2.1886]|nr:hypothetical protein [Parasaccharibacter sp. TMW 2.1886]
MEEGPFLMNAGAGHGSRIMHVRQDGPRWCSGGGSWRMGSHRREGRWFAESILKGKKSCLSWNSSHEKSRTPLWAHGS